MVVIREHRPCLHLPTVLGGKLMKNVSEQIQSARRSKVVRLLICAGGNYVCAGFTQSVDRGMRPISHFVKPDQNYRPESGGKPPHSKVTGVSRRCCGG